MQLPPKVTDRAFDRLAEIGAADQGQALRIAVEGGGCSGFQYEIALDTPKADDLVLEGKYVLVGAQDTDVLLRVFDKVREKQAAAG